jgi:hypothetical protein
MPKENFAAKQQRIGERLTRAMAKAPTWIAASLPN